MAMKRLSIQKRVDRIEMMMIQMVFVCFYTTEYESVRRLPCNGTGVNRPGKGGGGDSSKHRWKEVMMSKHQGNNRTGSHSLLFRFYVYGKTQIL